jgi:hypothetical protein
MRKPQTFRYATAADRCWQDKVLHPGTSTALPALLLVTLGLFMIL